VADAPAAQLDEQAELLWSAALAAWDTLENHEAFVKYCSRTGLLASAGRRYRERLDRDPRDAVAAQMQSRILTMATAGYIPPSPVSAPVTRSLWFWVVVVLCGVVGMTIAFILRR
jgi:predicted TPR repeat methyltransferase